MDYDIWVKKSLKRIEELDNNTRFYLKDLFKGFEWGELTAGDRRSFGKVFKNKVISGHIPHVRFLEKAANNSAVYKKEVF